MPLPVLVIIVVFGIALVVACVWLLGLSKPARLADADDARAQFAVSFPATKVEEVLVSADGVAAFLLLGGGRRIGLVEAFGARFITRILRAGDIEPTGSLGESGVRLHFADFSHPRGRYEFSSATDRDRLLQWCEAIGRQDQEDNKT